MRKKLGAVIIIMAVCMSLFACGSDKDDKDTGNIFNGSDEKTTAATEATTEAFSIDKLDKYIDWQGYRLEFNYMKIMTGGEWPIEGLCRQIDESNIKSSSPDYVLITLFATDKDISTSDITDDTIKEITLCDISGKKLDIFGYNYQGIVYSDATGFSPSDTQQGISIMYKLDGADINELYLDVNGKFAKAGEIRKTEVNDTENDFSTEENVTTEDTDVSIFEQLAGSWSGTGKPVGGGNDIALTVDINADGTGTYSFVQGTYQESYSFELVENGNSFDVSIPSDNQLGISSCEGTYEYDGAVLTLHIKTTFANGRTYEYDADLDRQ